MPADSHLKWGSGERRQGSRAWGLGAGAGTLGSSPPPLPKMFFLGYIMRVAP